MCRGKLFLVWQYERSFSQLESSKSLLSAGFPNWSVSPSPERRRRERPKERRGLCDCPNHPYLQFIGRRQKGQWLPQMEGGGDS